jgi:uncharacterized membrane protein
MKRMPMILAWALLSLAVDVMAQSPATRILVYSTRDYGTALRATDFDTDLPAILAQDGFSVAVQDRATMPTLAAAILSDYGQLWFVSTESSPVLTVEEVQAIQDFHDAGKGVMVIGDGCWYTAPANQFPPGFGAQYVSNTCCDCNHCGGSVGCPVSTAGFPPHEIWTGVFQIEANLNEGDLAITGSAQIIGTDNSINMVAASTGIGGRVAWDATSYRFTDASAHPDLAVTHLDNPRYVRNLANWLGKRILLYSTRDYDEPLRATDFDTDLPAILAQDGFSVAVQDRSTMPTLTAAILSDYGQLWFVSTEGSPVLTAAEVQAIQDFHVAGKGIMVIGDGYSYVAPANQFSPGFGAQFVGVPCWDCDHCGGPVGCPVPTAGFPSHAIWTGVSQIEANLNEGNLEITGAAQIIGTDNSINMVAASTGIGGRVAWDATFYRFTNASAYPDLAVTHLDHPRYVRNLANWLNSGCNCALQGNINGDAVIDVFDVIGEISITFSGQTDPQDAPCPTTRGDVNNDGVTDVFDVIYLIATAFSGGPEPVNPCGS